MNGVKKFIRFVLQNSAKWKKKKRTELIINQSDNINIQINRLLFQTKGV
jgi:hypothetical protein